MIFIKFNGSKYPLNLAVESSTIKQLREEISSICFLGVQEQKLIFKGKNLSLDTEILSNCGLKENDTILLLKQLNKKKTINLTISTLKDAISFKINHLTITDTIQNLRRLIEQRLPPNVLDQETSLFCNGVILENNRTLLDYKIQDQAIVYIVSKITVELNTPDGEKVEVNVEDSDLCEDIIEKLSKKKIKTPVKSKKRKLPEIHTHSSYVDPPVEQKKGGFCGFKRGFLSASPAKKRKISHQDNLEETFPEEPDNFLRCEHEGCNKKIRKDSIKCRCKKSFCSVHRYKESHSCTFNYKEAERELLKLQNPQIISSKNYLEL